MNDTVTILLAAGHGNADVGATWPDGTTPDMLQEHEICAQACWYTAAGLERDGMVKVIPVFAPTLTGKIAVVNEYSNALHARGDLHFACELHLNAGPPEARGVEVFYHGGNGHMQLVCEDLLTGFARVGARIRGARTERQAARGRLAWIQDTKCDACLVEAGFITNTSDREWWHENSGARSLLGSVFGEALTRAAMRFLALKQGPAGGGMTAKDWREGVGIGRV